MRPRRSRFGRFASRARPFARDRPDQAFAAVSIEASERTLAGEPEPAALLVDPLQPATVYVQLRTERVFRSDDGGKTWAQASAGLSVGSLSSLAVDPARSGVVYAGTKRDDVFRTMDYGKSWAGRRGAW